MHLEKLFYAFPSPVECLGCPAGEPMSFRRDIRPQAAML